MDTQDMSLSLYGWRPSWIWPKKRYKGVEKFEPYDFLVIWSLMMQYPPLTQFGQTNLANSVSVTSQPPLFLQLNVSTPCECHIVPIPVASLENPQSTVPMNGPQKTTSTVYWCIASKLKAARNLYWMSNMFLLVEIFLFFVCYHVVPKRHSQLDYELNNL